MAVLNVILNEAGKSRRVEMPDATALEYAALRVAEALGLDPDDDQFNLVSYPALELLDPDDVAADHDGEQVCLCSPGPHVG